MNSDINRGAISFLSLDTLDVKDVLLSVALNDLADLLALVVATHDLHLVVLSYGHASHAILGSQLL